LGESLGRWFRESEELGIMLAIWDLVKDEQEGKLGQIIDWPWPKGDSVTVKMKAKFNQEAGSWEILPDGGGKSAEDTARYGELLAQRGKVPYKAELLDRWQKDDAIEPAKYYLCKEVNKGLKGHVSPQVLPFLKDRICLFPDTLLSAMWLMLFHEVTGGLQLRMCDVCGEWKEYKKKRDTFYCSVRCQMIAYRKRHPKKP
jgi:hypothetical protein